MPHLLNSFPYFVAAWLFFCGLYGLVTSRHLIHAVVCLAILQSSTYILLLGIGHRVGGAAPIFAESLRADSPWTPSFKRSCSRMLSSRRLLSRCFWPWS
jgi:multisubunit Na+/H+ antiporter MnhC subunit